MCTHTRTLSQDSSSSDSSDDVIPIRALDPFQLEEEYHHPAALVFQAKLDELKVFVNGGVEDEVLRELLLMADMDVNRAANYYLNRQQ